MKFATFISAPQGRDQAEFQRWFTETLAPQLPSHAPTMRGCVYRVARKSPGTFFDAWADMLDPDFGQGDILIESWFSATEDFRREMLPLHEALAGMAASYASYHVTPRLHLDPRIAEAGPNRQRPEITSICTIQWKAGMAAAQASVRYDRHAAIALRCQTAITKYEQNIVEEVIAWSDGIIPIDAFADFSHRTVEDCRTGLVATREEMQDTSGYIQAGRFLYLGDALPVA